MDGLEWRTNGLTGFGIQASRVQVFRRSSNQEIHSIGRLKGFYVGPTVQWALCIPT